MNNDQLCITTIRTLAIDAIEQANSGHPGSGDATLFQRADMVEAGWNVIQPVLDVWKALPSRNFPNYAAGTWGPPQADELMRRDGRQWRAIE